MLYALNGLFGLSFGFRHVLFFFLAGGSVVPSFGGFERTISGLIIDSAMVCSSRIEEGNMMICCVLQLNL